MGRSIFPSWSRKRWLDISSASSRRRGCSMAIRRIARRNARWLRARPALRVQPPLPHPRPPPRARGRKRDTMGKKSRARVLSDNEAKAVARMLRVSPQKLNLLAQLIRGKKVATALADLEFSRKRMARDVRKCLESAIANAENNHDLDVDDLVVVQAHVGKGLVMKRFAPRARGRAGRILKPFANLTIVVREVEAAAS